MLIATWYILQDKTFMALALGFINGVPNFLHAEVLSAEYHEYKNLATLPNICKAPKLVGKQVVKEDSRNLSQLFDAQLVDFLPHTGIIPVGIATPKDKKPRLYWHGSCMLTESSQPINVIVNAKETEPDIWFSSEICFSSALMNHLTVYLAHARHISKKAYHALG